MGINKLRQTTLVPDKTTALACLRIARADGGAIDPSAIWEVVKAVFAAQKEYEIYQMELRPDKDSSSIWEKSRG